MGWNHLGAACLLILTCLAGARADCQFPTYLLTNSSDNTDFWHLADRYDGTYLTVRFRQSEATISYLPLNDTTPLHSNITCLAMDGEYTVVNITTLSGEKLKVCLQFFQKTPNVVTMNFREFNETLQVCQQSATETPVPIFLTAHKPKGEISGKCPPLFTAHAIVGTFYHPSNQSLCANVKVPSVIESDCVLGDGIRLYFSSNLCIPPNTGWTLRQHLYCLDSWEDKPTGFNYQLLGESYYEPRWCLRYRSDEPNRVQVFQDLACIAQPTDHTPVKDAHYISWHLNQLHEPACSDAIAWEGFTCLPEFCHIESYRRVCRQTCEVCKGATTSECTYDDVVGKWRLMDDSGYNGEIDVISENFSIRDYADFSCIRQLWESHFLTQLSTPAGCAAQFSCLHKFPMSQSPGLFAFQVYGKTHEIQPDPAIVCAADSKEDGLWPLNDRFISRSLKNVIKDPIHGIQPCKLGGWYNFHGVTGHGHSCYGNMTDINPNNCTADHSVHMSLSCTNVTRMFCLFEPRDSFHIAIAVTEHLTHASCILVRRDGDSVELSFLASPQCTWSTRDDILSGKRKFALRINGTRDNSVCYSTTPPVTAETTIFPDNSTHVAPPDQGNNHAAVLAVFFGVLLITLLTGIVAYFAYKYYRRRHPYRVL